MTDWWHSLNEPSRIFWGIAIAASILQLLMFAGSFFGAHDLETPPDSLETGGAEGMKLLSLRALVAFFVGFGWAGGLFLGDGMSLPVATFLAVACGGVFMGLIFLLMKLVLSLRDDGTLDYRNAIGQTGHVYVTIPAHRSGQGQIEILLQGRLITAHAVTKHFQPLVPQTAVQVDTIEGKTLLVVSPVS